MRIGIVGAGITGLATAHYLRQRDVEVVTFEADARPGGVIRSERVDGRLLEYGPQRLRLSDELRRIVDELSLADQLQFADDLPLYVYADGRLREVPRSISAFIRTDALSFRGKLRLLLEPLTTSAHVTEYAGPLLERKFGSEAYRRVIEPLLSGVYASDPARMPAEHAIAPLLRLDSTHRSLLTAAVRRSRGGAAPVVSFVDGLGVLPRGLAAAHGESLRFDQAVRDIRPESDAGGFVMRTDDTRERVDHVVVTAPAPTAAELLADFPDAQVDPLRSLRYSPLAIVHLEASESRDGYGYQIARDAGFSTLGVTWNDALFGRTGVHTAFLGGTWDPDLVDRPPDELGELARQEFEAVMDTRATVLDVTTLADAVPAYDDSWLGLADLELPAGITLATNYTGRIGVPGRLREAERVAQRLATPSG